MRNLTILALRIVLAMALIFLLFVQVVMVAQLAVDPAEFDAGVAGRGIPILVIIILGIVTIQVTMVCTWRLLTMVRRGTVFSHAAFRYVDVMIGAIVAAALLVFVLAEVLGPGEAVPPGGVLMIGGFGVAILGVALIVLVLRTLLAQAVVRDVEAAQLQAELDEVI